VHINIVLYTFASMATARDTTETAL